MTEEDKTGDNTPTQKDIDNLRSELDKKVAASNARAEAAENRATSAEAQIVQSKNKVNLPEASEEGLSQEKRTEIQSALDKGEESESNLTKLLPMYVEQQAKALALEVALEHEAKDDVNDIKARIKVGGTPARMEALAKEISLEYKEKAIDAKKEGKGEGDADESDSKRQFAEGGGKGSVSPNKFMQDVDAIDIDDPVKAQKELDALYEQLKK